MNSAYIKFIKLLDSVEEFRLLDPHEYYIVRHLLSIWDNGRGVVRVKDLLSLSQVGSPSMMHRKVGNLRRKNFLKAVNDPGDARIKILVPSLKFQRVIQKLDENIHSAARSTPPRFKSQR